ncbi:hypothetical protein Taro_034348 [Colocasia esculenta]|uniref:Uncharacterized protein n=1 Tax=Colocasia esculenta TaxID=4460 RepID=A0A843WF86_COLES|nr:hypothetical protein [Colocasia esculenta]
MAVFRVACSLGVSWGSSACGPLTLWGETFLLTWLLCVIRGDTCLCLPDLVEVWEVHAEGCFRMFSDSAAGDQEELLRSSLRRFDVLERVLARSHREDVAWSGGDAVPWMVFMFFTEFPWWYLVVVGSCTLCGYLFLVVHCVPIFPSSVVELCSVEVMWDWLSLLSLIREAHPPTFFSVSCEHERLFRSELRVAFLQVLEVFGSMGGGATFGVPGGGPGDQLVRSHCLSRRWFRSHAVVSGGSQRLASWRCGRYVLLAASSGGGLVALTVMEFLTFMISWGALGGHPTAIFGACPLVPSVVAPTSVYFPDLMACPRSRAVMLVWEVGACIMRLWSHVVAPVFRELLGLGGCVPRFASAFVGVPAALVGRDSLSQEFIAGQLWWRFVAPCVASSIVGGGVTFGDPGGGPGDDLYYPYFGRVRGETNILCLSGMAVTVTVSYETTDFRAL